MIVLNTSIQVNGEDLAGLDTLTLAITSLSERAEKANKAIAGISDSVVRNVNEANASMQWVSTEVGKIVARTEKAEETVIRIIDALEVIEGVKKSIEIELEGSAAKGDATIRVLEDCLNCSVEILNELRACETSFEMLQGPLAAIRELHGTRKQPVPSLLHLANIHPRGRYETDSLLEGLTSDELLMVGEVK